MDRRTHPINVHGKAQNIIRVSASTLGSERRVAPSIYHRVIRRDLCQPSIESIQDRWPCGQPVLLDRCRPLTRNLVGKFLEVRFVDEWGQGIPGPFLIRPSKQRYCPAEFSKSRD